MKIFQICNDYFGTKLYEELFKKLTLEGCYNEIFVFLKKDSKLKIGKLMNKNIIIVKCFGNLLRFFYFFKQKKIFSKLNDLKLDFDLDIVHAHTLFSNGDIAYRIKKKYKIPYIVTIRNTDINIFFKYFFFLRKYGIKIMDNAEKIIFLSPSYMEYCLKKYVSQGKYEEFRKKSIVIPNGIDQYWIENTVSNKKRNKEIRLIYVGSVNKNKNVRTTIRACKKLIERGYDVKFTIIGNLEMNIKELKEKFIKYIPFCSKEEIKKLFSENDIFVMPSKYETFGLVYAEALSQGLPIIYTRGQGFDKQIPEGKVGYSVEYNDVNEITAKIIEIYLNYDMYTLKTKDYINNFNWEYIAKKYKKIYNEILAGDKYEKKL